MKTENSSCLVCVCDIYIFLLHAVCSVEHGHCRAPERHRCSSRHDLLSVVESRRQSVCDDVQRQTDTCHRSTPGHCCCGTQQVFFIMSAKEVMPHVVS